jgi:hypothetical protein
MAAVAIAVLAFAVSASATIFVIRRIDSVRPERVVERRLQILSQSEL